MHKVRGWHIKFSPDKRGSATFSECEQYRYSLHRNFTTMFDSKVRWLNMLMLNPSTADAIETDPTVTRQGNRAMLLGCGGLMVTNIFAWRDTDPRNMKRAEDPVGPDNDYYILREAQAAVSTGGLVIAAWGTNGTHMSRAAAVRSMLADAGIPLHYLRLTKSGQPEHPLYISYNIEPKLWHSEECCGVAGSRDRSA